MAGKFERTESSIESLEHLTVLATAGIWKTLETHDRLGEAGLELVQSNQFGETALRVDVECEEAILNVLRKSGIAMRVHSEEYGIVHIGDNPRYLAVLDGLDGSSVFKKERGRGRYGTMFGISEGTDPTYSDYLVSGILEHTTKRLFIASKGGGAYVMLQDGQRTPIHSSQKTQFDPTTRIYTDDYWEIVRKTFSEKLAGYDMRPGGSTAVFYVDVASGAADMALDCTYKGNLEKGSGYGLIHEAGAAMVDINGQGIGDKKYLEFGQREQLPIVTAANLELAEAFLDYIKSKS